MKNFNKKLLALLVACSFAIAQADHKTDNIQILIDPAAPWFQFIMNDAIALVTNPLALRPAGATYIANGLIYPGGTIDTANQASFLVDKNGVPLTEANSIGVFHEFSAVLTDYALLPNVIPAGTLLNLSTYAFDFFCACSNNSTSLFGIGILRSTGVLAPRQSAITGLFAETGGTGKNKGADGEFTVNFIPAPGFTALVIEIEFSDKIYTN